MDHELPSDVRVEVLPEGVRYVLPKRDLGKGRHVGCLVSGMGVMVTGFMVAWMAGPIAAGVGMLREGKMFGWLLIGFGLLGTLGLVVGVGMLGAGLAIASNVTRSVVEVRRGKLWAVERFGWFGWTRKRPIEAVEKLELGPPLVGSDLSRKMRAARGAKQTIQIGQQLPKDLATIRAYGTDMKPLIVAPGYPLAMLRPLAGALSEQMTTGGKARLFDADEQEIAIVERTAQTEEEREAIEEQAALDRPAKARSLLEERADGLTITVPAAGLWKGSKGLMFFAVFWNGLVSVFLVIGVLMVAGIMEAKDSDAPGWVILLFMIPFVAVGVGTGLAAVNMGRRRAIIDVVGGTLLITRQSIFGTRQQDWPAEQIEKIVVGPSGMAVNDVPVMELQVHPKQGKKLGMLSQLDNEELRWIASTLRRALGLRQTH